MKSAFLELVNYPRRARYGVINNMHALLEFDDDPALLPAELLGLTDKPPGYVTPGERWWPSVGCCPLGTWWVLWWTMPDDDATRGGMVRSEVALWPIDAVPAIENLADVMVELNGGRRIGMPSEPLLKAAAAALIKSTGSTPIVGDLDAWPGLLAALWGRLWPEARVTFSARVAISPPQGGESVARPLLFGVLPSRINQWPSADIVESAAEVGESNRAADWLIGRPDELIEQLVGEGALGATSIPSLRRIARAADRIEDLRRRPDATLAIDALRTLCAIAPGDAAAQALKRESLTMIEEHLSTAPLQAILSLANFKKHDYPSSDVLAESVRRWASAKLPDLDPSDLLPLIETVADGNGEQWWLNAIRSAIDTGMAKHDARWYTVLFRHMCHSINLAAFSESRIRESEVEIRVLVIADHSACSSEEFKRLLQNTAALHWSTMHAWSLYKSQPANVAIVQQLAFKPAFLPGLKLLVERLPAAELVAAAVALGDARVLELASIRTKKTPSVIQDMDLSSAAWRLLWSFHVIAGGDPWPAGVDRTVEMTRFLSAALQHPPHDGVIARLASDFAAVSLGFPDRAGLWIALSANDAQSLADHTAAFLLSNVSLRHEVSAPEAFLRDAVRNLISKSSLNAGAAAMMISWEFNLSEYDARNWVRRIQDWSEGAQELGVLVHSRRWGSIADDLFGRYANGEQGTLAALNECKTDLSIWLRWRFSAMNNVEAPAPSLDILIERVAELGGDLASDRLEDVWQSAGGKKKQLLSQGTSAQRWNEAARCAAQGGLQKGLRALVDVLATDYPYNRDLQELRTSLDTLRQ